MPETDFVLRGAHITLEALLKASGQVASGGQAKLVIQQGQVQVDGQPELRRACKLRAGQRVQVRGNMLRLMAAPNSGAGARTDLLGVDPKAVNP